MSRSKHIKHGASRTIDGKVVRRIPKQNVRFLPKDAEILGLCNNKLRVRLDVEWIRKRGRGYNRLVREQ
jgi:hypothetical protein